MYCLNNSFCFLNNTTCISTILFYPHVFLQHLGCICFYVKWFLSVKYFQVKIFFEKENIFRCLVAFWKIFFSVWLCSWKYHRKHIFYLLLTFSQLLNKYIISFVNRETQKKQNQKKKKKFIKSSQFERRRKRERRLGSI